MKIGLLIIVLVGLCAALAGCQKKRPVASKPARTVPAPPSASPPVLSSIPLPAPLPDPAPPPLNFFQQGEVYFESGYYAEAAQAYENYLRAEPPEINQDRVLFRLAISYALPGYPAYDQQKAAALLRRLTTEYPDSAYKPQAQYLLDLQTEIERLRSQVKDRDERIREREERIKRLTSELENLKKIDMERRPSRPPN